ncbi:MULTISPECIES: hypothetical protein [Streptomyces]|uniref:Uncharacterized protein n=1 Tax=Streptomyces venezuelae TaxID=54571 RepID=A0A5P2AW85_STRVZ|nr:hypothetical protein [Streptomyces venezuelae]QES20459.1 hypothetical protein DEJ46_16125 [Streptomyces venezuelae]
MSAREHVTVSGPDPAPRRRQQPEPTGYVSQTVRRYAEARAVAVAEASADRYRTPGTREELLAMCSADQSRTYLDHRETYDRLMYGAAAP